METIQRIDTDEAPFYLSHTEAATYAEGWNDCVESIGEQAGELEESSRARFEAFAEGKTAWECWQEAEKQALAIVAP